VSRFLPEFEAMRVWRSGSVTNPVLDPVTEPIQMWHLMTHTAGLTYGFMFAHPVDELYRRAGFEWGHPAAIWPSCACGSPSCPCCSNPAPSGTTRWVSTCSAG
jgi:hypothetical protein